MNGGFITPTPVNLCRAAATLRPPDSLRATVFPSELVPTTDISSLGPTVAVVITTFNHARFLAEAVTSVLAQTRPADQIIVVDDGSTDEPALYEAANVLLARVTRLSNKRWGMDVAKRRGSKRAKEPWRARSR